MKVKKTVLDPLKFFLRLQEEKNVCFLTSKNSGGWGTVVAFNQAEKFLYKTGGNNRFKSFLKQNSKKGRKLIGFFSYDLGYELFHIRKKAVDDLALPDICFFAFDNYILFKGKTAEIHYRDKTFPEKVLEVNKRKISVASCENSRNFKPGITKKQYEKAYKKIKKHIFEGDIYQINLTYRLEATTTMHPRRLFTNIIRENPVDFLAYVEGDNFEVLSASPERFVKIKNRRIETCPIKGTRPRGRTKRSDEKQRKELLENRKEAAELNMITDLMRNDLGKVCEIGSVKVAGNRLLSKCPTVWHTYSKITGRIAGGGLLLMP